MSGRFGQRAARFTSRLAELPLPTLQAVDDRLVVIRELEPKVKAVQGELDGTRVCNRARAYPDVSADAPA